MRSVAFTEAARNVLATPVRFGTLLFAMVLLCSGPAAIESRMVADLLDLKDEQQRMGRYIVAIVPTDAEVLDVRDSFGEECEALGRLDGVVASGMVGAAGREIIASMPSSTVPVLAASPGALQLFGAPQAHGGYVGGSLADGLSVSPAGPIGRAGIEASTMEFTSIPPTSVRTGPVDGAIVDVLPADLITGTCYVEFSATGDREAALLAPAMLKIDSSLVAVARLPGSETLGPEPVIRYRDSLHRWLWTASAPIAVLLSLLITRARRKELVLYQAHGASPVFIAVMLLFEHIMLLVPVSSVGIASALWAASGSTTAAHHGVRFVAGYLLLSLCLTSVLSLRVFFWDPGYSVLRGSE